MIKKLRGVWEVLYGAVIELIADDGLVLAASIAFFTIFSLAPVLLLVVALAGLVSEQELLIRIVNGIIPFGVLTFLFGAAFKILSDVRISWRVVWFGGAVTALLFTIGKELIGRYLGQDSVASVYGAAGSMIVILMWVYYSSIIFLFGAEMTQLSAKALGWRLEPIEGAEPLDKERTREKVPARRAGQEDDRSRGERD